jgi:hypothetical protein
MKWQSLNNRINAVIAIALIIAASLVIDRQAHAEPANPPATKITVPVPTKATPKEIAARINAAINALPAPTTVLSGSISLDKMERVNISLVENPTLEMITDTRPSPAATQIPTTTLTWTNPIQPRDYCSATPDQLQPQLTYNTNGAELEIRANVWVNYERFDHSDMFYDDFSTYRTLITGTGTLTATMPVYNERPLYDQEAFASAFFMPKGSYEYLNQAHYTALCTYYKNRVFLPISYR